MDVGGERVMGGKYRTETAQSVFSSFHTVFQYEAHTVSRKRKHVGPCKCAHCVRLIAVW